MLGRLCFTPASGERPRSVSGCGGSSKQTDQTGGPLAIETCVAGCAVRSVRRSKPVGTRYARSPVTHTHALGKAGLTCSFLPSLTHTLALLSVPFYPPLTCSLSRSLDLSLSLGRFLVRGFTPGREDSVAGETELLPLVLYGCAQGCGLNTISQLRWVWPVRGAFLFAPMCVCVCCCRAI